MIYTLNYTDYDSSEKLKWTHSETLSVKYGNEVVLLGRWI